MRDRRSAQLCTIAARRPCGDGNSIPRHAGRLGRTFRRQPRSASLRSQASASATIVSRSSRSRPPGQGGEDPAHCRRPGPADRRRGAAPAARSIRPVGDPVDAVEHLEHREAAAIAAIHDVALLGRGDQPLERVDMGGGEVADMDIVAHAGAVGRVVVGAVDVDMAALAGRRLDRDLDQMGRARWSTGPTGPAGRRRRR